MSDHYIRQSCPYGLTDSDLAELLEDARPAFSRWMAGQTVMLCDGRTWDHGKKRYFTTACSGLAPGIPLEQDEVPGGHGIVTYRWDVDRFLLGLPVVD